MQNIAIIGAGVAGVSAAHHLSRGGISSTIYEKDNDFGGLCGSFMIDGFCFDRFIHLSFSDDAYISNIFSSSTNLLEHVPFPSNYYKGCWLRHPAQNNLAPLDIESKIKIISDFCARKIKNIESIQNYDEWLRCQYGDFFAENFPFLYTRKYWGVEPSELEVKWIGKRMYSPELAEVLRGAFETQNTCFYYAKKMKYPENGGYKSILNSSVTDIAIKYNKDVCKILPDEKKILFSDGNEIDYSTVISTIPLPEIVKMLDDVPDFVRIASEKLSFTSGYHISFGFNRPNIAKHLWFYIYDMDILPARVYSPNLKSPQNVPEGCSSLQAEVFWENNTPIPDKDMVHKHTVHKLIEMGVFKKEDILFSEIRFEKYANIVFKHDIYSNRETVMTYLKNRGIKTIGRFGRWDYLWSHQAYNDGITVAQEIRSVC